MPVFLKQALQKFSEAARVKYLMNENNKGIICYFEFKILEFEKETMIIMTAIFKFHISEITNDHFIVHHLN